MSKLHSCLKVEILESVCQTIENSQISKTAEDFKKILDRFCGTSRLVLKKDVKENKSRVNLLIFLKLNQFEINFFILTSLKLVKR